MDYLKKFKILIIAGVLLSVLIFSLHIYSSLSTLKSIKSNVLELGKFIVSSFEISNRFLFINNEFGRKKYEEFIKQFSSNKSIDNLIIYDEKGKILFVGKEGDRKLERYFPDETEIKEDNKNFIIYHRMERNFGAGMMGMMRMMRGFHPTPVEHTFYMALFLSKSSYNYFKKKMISDLIQMIILYIFMILILGYSYRYFKLYAELSSKINKMEKNAEMGKFANLLAHEIKNPLSSITGLLQYLLDTENNEQKQDILLRVRNELKRLNDMVNDFLTYGREIQLQLDNEDISEIISEVIEMLKYDIESKQLNIDIKAEKLIAQVDRNRMIQVFMNLILNAIDASKTGDTIKIAFERRKVKIINNVYETVKTDKIFDPFYTTKTVGSGLGLSIVKKIVELHGFRVYLENTDPFIIVLDFENGG
ncbi:two-component system, NtrC family, sensor histidine kinase [Deferribacter desulfuricans SSM1]|uniref:histidine kinase n=1 Tax=Deferribacter desulfuricans (strain DSM 14783 / JCM 11476 / NBRC 101012 / SSM1) TaxID=639282 RepID=D3PA20_DEFDS|nr:HAMP domain-containing sensor histidine kinase [Deferribacter desulfuricans]BAI81560.1 two-component system, NtrC family, sensor histidine kinase [Deferribacter desulfuricans SSM1]